MLADMSDLTRLLDAAAGGDPGAAADLLPLVYDELRKLAAARLAAEAPGHTLQPTALVHEAYLRLIDQRRVDWKNRAQFFGLAANMMRRILVNHARDRAAAKRGGDISKVTLSVAPGVFDVPELTVLALDEALEKLAQVDERKSRIVEFKFFTGLTTEEIAEVLGISTATVEREWKFARAWLYNALIGRPAS